MLKLIQCRKVIKLCVCWLLVASYVTEFVVSKGRLLFEKKIHEWNVGPVVSIGPSYIPFVLKRLNIFISIILKSLQC